MRIKLDRTKCDGFGVCAAHAPDVFSLDDWGYASMEIKSGEIPPEREDDVQRALLDCPVHAILRIDPSTAAESRREALITESSIRH